jgi:hypothetical protein
MKSGMKSVMCSARQGKRVLFCLILVLLGIQVASAGGAQQKDDKTILEFGMRIEAPKTHNRIPLHVALIPLKPLANLKPLPDGKPIFIVFNLDIYGGDENKKVAVGQEGFDPPITVYLSYRGEGKMASDSLWYWIPAKGWILHGDLIKNPVGDMEVTPILYDAKLGYYFRILKWPTSDRMIASDG